MTKWIVTARAMNPETGEWLADDWRDEEIDTETNELFEDWYNAKDVYFKYEAFWNRINDSPREIVLIKSVREELE